MGWLGSSEPRSVVGGADGRTGYGESKSIAGRSSWSVEPVRHPFQLTTPSSNGHSAQSASIGSNAPLHPQSSHLDMLPTPTADSSPPTIPFPLHPRPPSARSATVPSRLTFRARPTHSWIIRNKYLPLLLIIPFPLLLSVLYCIIGHAVLRAARHPAYERAVLSSSAEAGAVGGAILTLPIIALVFAVQRLVLESADVISEDFFDDESDAGAQFSRRGLLLYFFVVIIAVFVGAVAGPVGLSVLKNTLSPDSSLVASHGAVAGVVGGLICSPLLVLSLLVS